MHALVMLLDTAACPPCGGAKTNSNFSTLE
jgi:hypothetical protein